MLLRKVIFLNFKDTIKRVNLSVGFSHCKYFSWETCLSTEGISGKWKHSFPFKQAQTDFLLNQEVAFS